MSSPLLNVATQRAALLADHRLGRGGIAEWTAELVAAAIETAGIHADLQVGMSQDGWSVQATVYERPVVLVDSDGAFDQGSLDRLELRAARLWRDLTRSAASFEPRPWAGAVRVVGRDTALPLGVERLAQLVSLAHA